MRKLSYCLVFLAIVSIFGKCKDEGHLTDAQKKSKEKELGLQLIKAELAGKIIKNWDKTGESDRLELFNFGLTREQALYLTVNYGDLEMFSGAYPENYTEDPTLSKQIGRAHV